MTHRPLSTLARTAAVALAASLAAACGCAPRDTTPIVDPPEAPIRTAPAATRPTVTPPRPATTRATSAPTTSPTTATAPSDHHAAPPRRTGP